MGTRVGHGSRPGAGFRADIQGLRAIAVLVVIASHAGLPFFPGGYVGVDVFFVVSGFLISTLLFSEVGRSGTLSLTGFYARRARRILPAATVVTLATMAASVLLLSLVEARLVARDALWVTAFGANIHFAALGTDYFAKDEPPSPLQHYWSLSVEEQFYLVWPLILLLVVWAVRRAVPDIDARQSVVRRAVLPVLLAICAASLVYSWKHTGSDPTSAYFSTLTRAFELGLGAVTALVSPWFSRRATDRFRALLLAAGLAAVAVSCLTFTSRTPFPGVAALLPVLGAVALILAGTASAPTLSHRVLGVAPMRVVGDWSYSLYLWHWPVLIIARRLAGDALSPVQTAAALALVFALSGASYRFVETPFRSGRRLSVPRALLLYPVSLGLALSGFAASHAVTTWELGSGNPPITLADFGVSHPDRYRLGDDPGLALVRASVIAARHDMAIPSELSPPLLDLRNDVPDISDCDYSEGSTSLCPRGDVDADRTIVVVGDSHGRMWIPALDAIGARDGWKVYYFVKPHCTAALVAIDEAGNGERWDECSDFHTWTHDQIATLHPDLVVVSSAMFNHTLFTGNQPVTDDSRIVPMTGAGFEQLFRSLQPLTRRLVLIRDVPQITEDPSTCLSTEGHDLGDCLFSPNPRSRAMADQSVAAAGRVGIPVIDPTPWICWDGSCPLVVGSTITYRDGDHLSGTYAGSLTDRIEAALGLKTS